MMWVFWTYVRTAVGRLPRGEGGNSVIEYAMLVVLVAVLCLAAVGLVGATTSDSLSRSASSIR